MLHYISNEDTAKSLSTGHGVGFPSDADSASLSWGEFSATRTTPRRTRKRKACLDSFTSVFTAIFHFSSRPRHQSCLARPMLWGLRPFVVPMRRACRRLNESKTRVFLHQTIPPRSYAACRRDDACLYQDLAQGHLQWASRVFISSRSCAE